ncbi:MAG: type II toxin-antitoxin system RelE/ParE family toxin [Nostoc sp.]|uniref:type II toxin-antitoxin system RelE/ParE family toxin n=1 Tax=Nostoc sp. TaxID=1180 RepID=UPI002FF31F8E
MTWNVEYTNEFENWWLTLEEDTQDTITAVVNLLAEKGTALPFPYSSGISNSRHSHMRELRIQYKGNPVRVFYAFDPRRSAILLIGGDKTGNDRFYEEYVPIADRLYDEYIEELKQEGLL